MAHPVADHAQAAGDSIQQLQLRRYSFRFSFVAEDNETTIAEFPRQLQALDPLAGAAVIENGIRGRVDTIEFDNFERVTIYRVLYEDGDLRHVVKDELIQIVCNDPRTLQRLPT